jgi:hypothetical protein
MKQTIPIVLVVEDQVSEVVLKKMLVQYPQFVVARTIRHGGYGYIKSHINGFNQAARGMPYLVLTDLDRGDCAIQLISDWLTGPKHDNLIFRVAVKEVESWVMADRRSFARFLRIPEQGVPPDTDLVDDPKRTLVNLARSSPNTGIRSDLVPRHNSTAQQGRLYSQRLSQFVEESWNPDTAKNYSRSLNRALRQIESFKPVYPTPG